MKNRLLALAAAAVLASPMYAINWTDTTNSQPLKLLQGWNGNSTYSSEFNILDNGYNPAVHVITSATVTFWFADDESDGSEQVEIKVNGVTLVSNLEVDGAHPQSSFASYAFSLNSANDINGLIAALQDGKISYSVQVESGQDTYLKIASLTATGTTRGVPDGGATAIMLGAGLLALAAARKRFSAK
jgi:hypothetical protein